MLAKEKNYQFSNPYFLKSVTKTEKENSKSDYLMFKMTI